MGKKLIIHRKYLLTFIKLMDNMSKIIFLNQLTLSARIWVLFIHVIYVFSMFDFIAMQIATTDPNRDGALSKGLFTFIWRLLSCPWCNLCHIRRILLVILSTVHLDIFTWCVYRDIKQVNSNDFELILMSFELYELRANRFNLNGPPKL